MEGQHQGAPRLAGYRILGKLGEGGMGAVWRATQLGTNRDVAIKTITAGRLSEQARMRFALEIEVTAQLDHPFIGRLYESKVDENLCYYAMEYIEGQDFEGFIEDQKPTQRLFLEIMLDVCRAVQYAHQKGIIHRDLKPGNVMITGDSSPKVVDFGLAKLADQEQDQDNSKITSDGMVVGTPAYMSPEQIQAKPELIDTRTDVYALGVMLYEEVVGAHPHNFTDGNMMGLFMNVIKNDPIPARSVRKDIDRDLEAVVMKALARDPAERYATAGDVADDLERYLGGEPVLAQPQTALYLLRKKIVKHKAKFALAALAALSFVAFVAGSFVIVAQERDDAEQARDDAEQARAESDERFELGRSFAHALIFELDSKLKEGPTAARAEVIDRSRTYLQGLRKGAGERPDLMVDIARVELLIGEVQRQQGSLDDAIGSYKQGMKTFEDLKEKGEIPEGQAVYGLADSHFLLGRAYRRSNQPKKARSNYKKALKMLEAYLKKDPKDAAVLGLKATVHQDYGRLISREGNQSGAEKEFKRSLKMRKKKLKAAPKDTDAISDLSASHFTLGGLRLDQGKPSDALTHYTESLELREKLVKLAPDNVAFDQKLAKGYLGMGWSQEAQGKLGEAIGSFEKARTLHQRLVDNDPTNARLKTDLLWDLVYLSDAELQKGNLSSAARHLDVAVPLSRVISEANAKNKTVQRLRARTLYLMGRTHFLQKKASKAREHLDGGLEITGAQVESNPNDPYALDMHARLLFQLGEVAFGQDKVSEARKLYKEALKVRRKLLKKSPDDKYYQKAFSGELRLIGELDRAEERHKKAIERFSEAIEVCEKLLKIDISNALARSALIKVTVDRAGALTKASGLSGGDKRNAKTKGCKDWRQARELLDDHAKRSDMTPELTAASETTDAALKKCR